jgi:hypothetical protein
MKVLLKCAQAIGLAATTATLLLPAIPSQAQALLNNQIPPSTFNTTPTIQFQVTPKKPGLVTFINKGAYVASYRVTYTLNGQTHLREAQHVAVGQKRSFEIPVNATKIHASGSHFIWMVIHGEHRGIFNQSFSTPPNVCYTTIGPMGGASVQTSFQPNCHQ